MPIPLKMLPAFTWGMENCICLCITFRMTSEMPKTPIIAGMKEMPFSSSTLPKVNRG